MAKKFEFTLENGATITGTSLSDALINERKNSNKKGKTENTKEKLSKEEVLNKISTGSMTMQQAFDMGFTMEDLTGETIENDEDKLANLEMELAEVRTERDTLMTNYNTRAQAREEEIVGLENEEGKNEEIQAKINQLKEDGVADKQSFTKAVDDLTKEESSIQSEINKLKGPKKETHEEITTKLDTPAELPGLAEEQAALDAKKNKEAKLKKHEEKHGELQNEFEKKISEKQHLVEVTEKLLTIKEDLVNKKIKFNDIKDLSFEEKHVLRLAFVKDKESGIRPATKEIESMIQEYSYAKDAVNFIKNNGGITLNKILIMFPVSRDGAEIIYQIVKEMPNIQEEDGKLISNKDTKNTEDYLYNIIILKRDNIEKMKDELNVISKEFGLKEEELVKKISKLKKELGIGTDKETFLALVKEYKELKASYEAKMARIAELDKIIEENKNNPAPEEKSEEELVNTEEISDEELDKKERELEEKIQNKKSETGATETLNESDESTSTEDKKADIERRRQEEIENNLLKFRELGLRGHEDNYLTEFDKASLDRDKINAKYDAELAALENDRPSNENAEVENYEKPFIPEGMWTTTPDKISHVNEKGEEFKLGDEIYQTPAQGNAPIYEYLGRITGFDDKFAYITSRNDTVDKRPINTDVLTKKVPDGMEIIGK